MKHIQKESGARANLRGKGSGHVELGQREEQLESLHIVLTAERQADLDHGKRLCEDLFATVKAELEATKVAPAPVPMSQMQIPPAVPFHIDYI